MRHGNIEHNGVSSIWEAVLAPRPEVIPVMPATACSIGHGMKRAGMPVREVVKNKLRRMPRLQMSAALAAEMSKMSCVIRARLFLYRNHICRARWSQRGGGK